MEEKICKMVEKRLCFIKSEEMLSVKISIENISPDFREKLKTYLDSLYEDAIKELNT